MQKHLIPAVVASVLLHGIIFFPLLRFTGNAGDGGSGSSGTSVSVAFVGGDGFVDPGEHQEIVEALISQGDEEAFSLLFPDVESRDIFGNLQFKPAERLSNKIPGRAQTREDESRSGTPQGASGAGSGSGEGNGSGTGTGGNFSRARLTHGPKPSYPASARSAGFEGRVVLEVKIGLDGGVTAATLLLSSGCRECDDAALSTVTKSWTFTPALRDGIPTESMEKVLIMFQLNPK